FVDDDLADGIELAHLAVGTDDALWVREPPPARHRSLDFTSGPLAILRVHAGEKRIERDAARLRLQSVNPVELVRPHDGVGARIPFPAADVGDLLGCVELVLRAQGSRVHGRRFDHTSHTAHCPRTESCGARTAASPTSSASASKSRDLSKNAS